MISPITQQMWGNHATESIQLRGFLGLRVGEQVQPERERSRVDPVDGTVYDSLASKSRQRPASERGLRPAEIPNRHIPDQLQQGSTLAARCPRKVAKLGGVCSEGGRGMNPAGERNPRCAGLDAVINESICFIL